MSYNLKGITLKIGADITGLEKSLSKIKAETAGLDKTMNNLKKSMKFDPKLETEYRNLSVTQDLLATKIGSVSKQWNAASQQVIKQESVLKSLKQQMAAVDTSTAEGRKQARALQKDYDALSQSTMAVKAKEQALHNQLIELQNGFISTDSKVLKTYSSMAKLERVTDSLSKKTKLLSLASVGALTAAGAAAISFEDAFTGVTKTVEGTPEQLEKVNQGLKNLAVNTSSSYQTIAHYAELAGQMGVPTKAVVGFTKTVTELGDTTNLVGEEAAQSLAKFSNIMVSDSKKTNNYYSRLGSTIVDLGNKFATTEKDITQMSLRLGVAGKQVGFNSNQVLGLSTALSSLGIKANAGGGSISKMLKRIQLAVSTGNEDLQKFAQVSGMTSEEFQKAWGEDAAGTFLKFVKGIGNTKDVTKTLDDLNIKEIRQAQAMGALAQSSNVLERALNTSATAWSNNSAMATEAEKRYNTMKSQLIQAWEAIKQAFASLGQSMAPTITAVAKSVKNIALGFTQLSDGTKMTIGNILLFTAALSPTLKLTSKFAGGVQSVLGFMGTLGSKALTSASNMRAMATTMETVSGGATIMSANLMTNAASVEKLGQKMIAMQGVIATATPIIMGVTAAIAAIGITVGIVVKKKQEMMEANRKEMEQSDALYKATQNVIKGYDEYQSKVEQIKSQSSSVMASYEENAQKTEMLTNEISQLSQVESMNASQKQLMKEAVSELNSIYPDFQYRVDETSGKLVDQNGNIVTNIDSFKQYMQTLMETAKKQAEAQAYFAKLTLMTEQKAEYDALSDSLDELYEKQRKLQKQAGRGNIQAASKLETVNDDIQKTKDKLGKTNDELRVTQKEVDNLGNHVKEADFDQGFKDKLTKMQEEAKNTGIKIPKALANAIKNGKGDVQSATDYMSTFDAYKKMIDNAGKAGMAIPQKLATEMLNNCGSIQEQIDVMNAIMNFQSIVDNAGATGTKIPSSMAQGIIENYGTLQEQMDAINRLGQFQQLIDNAKITGIQIPQSLAEQVAAGTIGVDQAFAQIQSAAEFRMWASKQSTDTLGSQQVQNLIDAVANGTLSYDEACKQYTDAGLGNKIPKDMEKSKKEAEKGTKATVKVVNDQVGPMGAAGSSLGQAFYNSFASWINGVISLAKKALNKIKEVMSASGSGGKNGSGPNNGKGHSVSAFTALKDRISELPSYITAQYALPEIRTVDSLVGMASGLDSLSPRRMAMLRAATGTAVQVATATVSSIPTSLNYGTAVGGSNSYGLYGLLKNISDRLSNIETRTDELERPVDTTVHVVSVLDGDKVSDTVIDHIERIASMENKSRGGS